MTALISVIIPVYRDWDRLALCLEALEGQSLPPSRFEIVVANNEPDAHCPLDRLPANARLVHEPTPGSYAARNAAVAVARGKYLAFTDSDCIPEPDWLEQGIARLQANPDARVAGAIDIFREAETAYHAYVHDLHAAFRQCENVTAGVCVTANLMVARDVFDRVGRFDERYSGGDIAWNRRAQSAGVPILYADEMRVGHPARRTLREILRKKRRTAGSAAHELAFGPVLWEALKPPLRRLSMLREQRVGWAHSLIVFGILWAGRIVRAQEIGFIRLGLKKPNRS